jgi:hypothetical protein
MLNGIIYAIKHATTWEKWVVIVVPPGDSFDLARRYFASSVPDGAGFSGRTARVGKGKVSLVASNIPVFKTPGEPYSVIFLGWGTTESVATSYMGDWRQAAVETLALGQ